jgi:hypothetical protein
VTIYNKKGDSLEAAIRLARPEEAPQMIDLVEKQYGKFYYPEIYDEKTVRHALETASLRVAVAELEDGSIAGMIGANEKNVFTGSLMFTMLILRMRFRGFGLGKILQRFLLDSIPPDAYTCVYSHCLTLDAIVQTTHYKFGYRLTGLLLNCYIYDTEAEYLAGLSPPYKESHIIACLPQMKKDAGKLYAPSAHAAYIAGVYTELDVQYSIIMPEEAGRVSLTRYSHHQDETHRYDELFIQEAGRDFSEVMEKAFGRTSGERAFNIFINMNDPACPYAVSFLEKQGFFFTGIQPLAGDYEYLILHYSRDLAVPFEQIAIIPEFLERLKYIEAQYKEARHVGKN